MKPWYTAGRWGNRCAPQHLPSSQQPCVSLTDRQLCKRGELKVALSPELPEIHPDTPSSGEDRRPSCLLIIKAASCNIKNGPLLREHRYVDIIHQPKYYGSLSKLTTKARPLKISHQHYRNHC